MPEGKLTQVRMEHIVRHYHTPADAAAATGYTRGSLSRAARRYGLKFKYRRLTNENRQVAR